MASSYYRGQGNQKKKYVEEMFNDISRRYDLFNTLSSLGIDRYWRNRLIKKFNLSSDNNFIDVATGTGDVVFNMYNKFWKKFFSFFHSISNF